MKYLSGFFLALVMLSANAEDTDNIEKKSVARSKLVKVAVTDLTYKQELSRQIKFIEASEKADIKASGKISERETSGINQSSYSRNQTLGDSSVDRKAQIVEGDRDINFIRVGELRSMTGDIKAEMIKSGAFKLVQGKPYTSRDSEEIYNVIQRIKNGYYPGADYVLFGTLIDIQALEENAVIQGSDSSSVGVSVDIAAEFNLINTKTYEVVAAFSAAGEGRDVKLIKPGSSFKPSRVKAIREVSKSLAEDSISQLLEQAPNLSTDKTK